MDVMERLIALGFTEYEAKVYLSLLNEYPASGYRISKQAGVPRSMVYEALGRLNARGAVMETSGERATLYRPLPPDVLLERLSHEHADLLSGLEAGLRTLYEARSEDRVWSVSGRRSVVAYAARMLREAAEEALLVLTDEDVVALSDEILAACERGVAVSSLLTGQADLPCGRVAHHPPLESELQQLTATLMVVVDGAEVLVSSSHVETTATVTRNQNLVLIARQFIWMELFAQRVYAQLGAEMLARLQPEDRRIFESLAQNEEER